VSQVLAKKKEPIETLGEGEGEYDEEEEKAYRKENGEVDESDDSIEDDDLDTHHDIESEAEGQDITNSDSDDDSNINDDLQDDDIPNIAESFYSTTRDEQEIITTPKLKPAKDNPIIQQAGNSTKVPRVDYDHPTFTEMMSKSKVYNEDEDVDDQEEEERPYGEDASQFVEDHFKNEDEVREEIKANLRGKKGDKSYYR
jgi:hypothetical protein